LRGQSRPIINTEYVKLLRRHQPSIQWEKESEEAYFEYEDMEREGVGEVWYPTLYSIKLVLIGWPLTVVSG
jgi:spore germination protein YaaH